MCATRRRGSARPRSMFCQASSAGQFSATGEGGLFGRLGKERRSVSADHAGDDGTIVEGFSARAPKAASQTISGNARRLGSMSLTAPKPQLKHASSSLQPMGTSPDWPRNRLLLALPTRDLKRLLPELERIPCHAEQVLMDADSALDHVFFPDSGVVSVLAVYADGSAIEMATIGREGCTGVQAILGAKVSSARFLVQIPGSAAKMPRAAFTRAMRAIPAFRNLTNAYVQAFLSSRSSFRLHATVRIASNSGWRDGC